MEAFMLDKEFLRKLDASPRREVYARITSLTFDEQPIECIDGRITGGSVNIDGASSVRRTCSLSLVTEKLNINDYIWGIRTKFHLEVGLKNEIDDNYPDICWFNLGYYVTTSFTSSISANSRTISIQGKDKMCLLNGDIGGNLPSIIDFGREEWYDYDYEKVIIGDAETYNKYASELYVMDIGPETGDKEYNQASGYAKGTTYYKKVETYTPVTLTEDTYQTSVYYIQQTDKTTKLVTYVLANDSFDASTTYYRKDILQNYHIKPLLIKKIIKEGVHAWGGEPYHNIIINDLDTYGMEQLTYRDNAASDDDENTDPKPLFIIKNLKNDTFQVTLDGDRNVYIDGNATSLIALSPDNGFIFDTGIIDATKVALSNPAADDSYHYTVLRVNDTEDAGYRITDLTYVPEDGLTCSVGETFTSVLDKIKTLLDDFEYFYNLDGQFVFQRKKTYTNVNFSAVHNLDLENLYTDSAATAEPVTYDFSDNFLISAININPTLTNVKNDYAIQGKRTTAFGAEVPIHLRYAIDKKPVYYKAIDGTAYISTEYYQSEQWELNQSLRKLKEIKNKPGGGQEVVDFDEAAKKRLQDIFWNKVIKKYIDSLDSEDAQGIKNYFWDLHHQKWWRQENHNLASRDQLTPDKVIIDDLNHNITYKPGWWDLEAWQKFYEVVTQQPANKNLVLYSGYKLDKKYNSRMWEYVSDKGGGRDRYHYQAWVLPNNNQPVDDVIKSTDRIFILTIDFTNEDEEDPGSSSGHQWGTIKVVFPNTTTSKLYQTTYTTWAYAYEDVTFASELDFVNRDYERCFDLINGEYKHVRVEDNFKGTNYVYKYRIYQDDIPPIPKGYKEAEPSQYVTYSYPETFGIYGQWTCDLAVQKLITENRGAWIFNPQFPEGSFQEAFEAGFKRWLSQINDLYLVYASNIQIVDWREIIYQMSKDYLKYSRSDTIVTTAELDSLCNPEVKDPTVKYWWPYGYKMWEETEWKHYRTVDGETKPAEVEAIPIEERLTWRDIFTTAIMKNNPKYYWTGVTGYEQYYTDLNAFWRQLYNPHLEETVSIIKVDVEENNTTTQKDKWISDFFFSDNDIDNITAAAVDEGVTPPSEDALSKLYRSNELRGWNYKLYFQPTALDFWFDFLDEGEVAQSYGVRVIGLRTKAVSNDKVSAVYFTKLPTICFYTSEDSENWKRKTADQVMKQSGYTFALLPKGLENNFTISSRQLSAKDYLDALLYQFSYVPEQLSITALPIYYLEPNTRIYVHDDETAIDGEYIVNKITLPLTYNGTMSISANKAPERII